MAADGDPIPEEDLEAVTLVVPEPNPQAFSKVIEEATH
jgi:hypothetical protein